MRILHTSDWHIGRSFFGVNTVDAFRRYADFLIDAIAEHSVDVVAVAGDVFDRAVPPLDAITVYEDTVARVLASGARMVLTSGNHDSHQRLGLSRRLMDSAGLHIRTSLSDIERPCLFGTGADRTAVYGIPYLEPALVHEHFGTARTHSAVLGEAMRRVHAHRAEHHPDCRLVVLAHAFVSGGQPSESERSIEIGGVGRAELALFADCDYAALGHLHRPQVLSPTVRYAGSPLPYSFSESAPKTMWLYDSATAHVEAVPLPVFFPIATLTGTVDEVLLQAGAHSEDYVQVIAEDPAPPAGALARLRQAFPQLVNVQWSKLHTPTPERTPIRAAQRSDPELFDDFVEAMAGRTPSEHERELFAEALTQAVRA